MVARKTSIANNPPVTLDRTFNCKSANVIYLFICEHCCSEQGTTDYYLVVQWTLDKLHERVNGHRTHFKTKNVEYKKSALALHVLEKNPDHFSENLENFHLCII